LIPLAEITAWRSRAPWPSDAQVEQDLVLSRALVEIFRVPDIASAVAFRGGTALHKLFFDPAGRYSEDIDLVQRDAGPIGAVLDRIREALDPWLGRPKRRQGQGRVTIIYRFETTSAPAQQVRLKIEINTREHFSVLGLERRGFEVKGRWFSGGADINVFQLDELLGTKLRALYQRKKGRDLYDLWLALSMQKVRVARVVECFERYTAHGETPISRAELEENLAAKLREQSFREDVIPLIPTHVRYNPREAAELVQDRLVSALSGDPWKGGGS
jgi:predicted nucleotidyltransferase component of viral defense system